MKPSLVNASLAIILGIGIGVAGFLAMQYSDKDPQEYLADGIWSGKFDINGRGNYDFTALYIDGIAVAVSHDTNMVYYGRVDSKQNHYESQLAMYLKSRGRKFGEVELNGSFLSPNEIDAQFLTVGAGDQGKLLLQRNTDLFQQHLTTDELAGKWILYQGVIILKFMIYKNGQIRGADTKGCAYEGNVATEKPGVNAYRLHVFVSSCHHLNGEMNGIAYLGSSIHKNDTFNMHLFGQDVGLFLPVVRNQDNTNISFQESAAPEPL